MEISKKTEKHRKKEWRNQEYRIRKMKMRKMPKMKFFCAIYSNDKKYII
jgi:hypothetical protein